ncbi:MAG TPA: hypothetical protein VF061_06775, partial [Gemmatimonadales bacterium]
DFPETFIKVAPALQRTGNWDPKKAWGTDGLYSGDLAADIGASGEGLRGTFPGTPEDAQQSVAFDKLWNQSEPTDVERLAFDAQQFDAVTLCYLAAVAAGSTDGQEMADALIDLTAPGGTEYTWEELPAAVQALQDGEDIDYQGAAGSLDLNEDGDATGEVYDLYQFTGGSADVVGEVEVVVPE